MNSDTPATPAANENTGYTAAGLSVNEAVNASVNDNDFGNDPEEERDGLALAAEIAHVRHDLMNPINQIIGYSEMLIEEAVDVGQDAFVPDLHRIRNASNTLVALVDDFFGSRLQDGENTAVPFAKRAIAGILLPSEAPQEAPLPGQSRLLVVDDQPANRDVLSRRLRRQGHYVNTAQNGREGLEKLRAQPFDVVLLDVLMPEMDGYQMLQQLKADTALRHLPVIMISALSELDSVVRCIEMGAEDYLSKPFNPILLRARIGASLEKKRLRDREREYLELITLEREKADRLLLNILPNAIADRLKAGETLIADRLEDVTVLFADIVGFTRLASHTSPNELVELLNTIFSRFDQLAEEYGLEKIKTIGDAYMVVGGLSADSANHVEAVADVGLAMCRAASEVHAQYGSHLQVRIGMHVGAVVAGVIGRKKFAYDLWGDTVNIAYRLQATSEPGRVHVTQAVRERLEPQFTFTERGDTELKGLGKVATAFLTGRK